MNRRRFVGTFATVFCGSFAGCTGFGDSETRTRYALEMYPLSAEDFRETFARSAGDVSTDTWTVLEGAIQDRRRTYGRKPVDDGLLVEYEGAFYRVSVEETGRTTHERPILRAEVVDVESVKRTVVAPTAYPPADGKPLRHAARNAVDRSEQPGTVAETEQPGTVAETE